ncbi:hypothetical protein [Parashewanella tropica]|uniref:hypothetical protein n=1 Tax=Parashewanella tropica TaxID=2547970 RepID=UPI00105A13C3|nr:hypothetical protein [Parashewanella tropica]
MLLGMLLSASYWVDIADKQALVCNIDHFPQCIQQLPSSLQQPIAASNIKKSMAFRDAMVVPVSDNTVSGVIFLRSVKTDPQLDAFVDGIKITLNLKQQQQLNLWHEQGHLHNEQIIHPLLKRRLTKIEHEAFADLYTLWQSVHTTQSFHLAWQQYHRRNLNVINSQSDYSHWSVPLLHHVLTQYSPEQVIAFGSYREFAENIIQEFQPLSKDEQREFQSLIRHLFHSHSTFNQPHYLSWRRDKLSTYLTPTLAALLNQTQAQSILKALALPLNHSLNPS